MSIDPLIVSEMPLEIHLFLSLSFTNMLEAAGRDPFYAQGLRFSCTRCSACCRFESGYVFLSKKDASRLMAALNMGYKEFTETYCRWIFSGNGIYQLSLKEKSNNDCIFWVQGIGCSVYDSRPLQCRAFPFWSSVVNSQKDWKKTGADCPGMDRGMLHSPDSIEKWLVLQQNEPIISKSVKN